MKIRSAAQDDLLEVVNILNKAAQDLHSKGINQWDYPWDEKEILQQIHSKYLYILSKDEVSIGTFGIRELHHLSDCEIEQGSQYLFQIAILPEYQGMGYGEAITDWACTFARDNNSTLYLDCWAGNEKLKRFYRENGFQWIGDFTEEDYYISVFKYK
jgi:ribosomal protein S18 acetylase RimI-like enzyme